MFSVCIQLVVVGVVVVGGPDSGVLATLLSGGADEGLDEGDEGRRNRLFSSSYSLFFSP